MDRFVRCTALAWLASAVFSLTACGGGGGSSSSAAAQSPSGSASSPSTSVTGVSIPSSVSVVTAKNTP